jgi:hypothetical protein
MTTPNPFRMAGVNPGPTYRVLTVHWDRAGHEDALQDALNKASAEGWRLAGFSDSGHAYTVILEKV